MRISSFRLGKLLATSLLLVPLALASCNSSVQSEANPKSSKSAGKTSPASREDIFLYRAIGVAYVCRARQAEVEFSKALGISAATYAELLLGRHGGMVKEAGDKKLNEKQLYSGAEIQIVSGALQYCPKSVPEDTKNKFDEFVKKQKELSNKE